MSGIKPEPINNKDLELTPISVLQDLSTRKLEGRLPDYRLVSSEGYVHKPTFIFRVEVAGIVATASGQSKKKAKHAAALKALEELTRRFPDDQAIKYINSQKDLFMSASLHNGLGTAASSALGGTHGGGDGLASDEVDGDVNPVGKLQEICMKKRWRPPSYSTTEEEGLPHERLFTLVCQVDCDGKKVTSRGSGRSKKLAKRSAAAEMITKLECGSDDVSASFPNKSHIKPESIGGKSSSLNDGTVAIFAGQKVNEFLRGIGDELNTELDLLFRSNRPAVEIVQTVADFLECSVEFVELPRSDPSRRVFIVNLNPLDVYHTPISVVSGWGSGFTDSQAREAAAKKAIELLKEIRRI